MFSRFILAQLLLVLLAITTVHSASIQVTSKSCLMANLRDANFPTTKDGRTYHLEIKRGEVSNLILTVGDLERAQHYADLYLDKPFLTHILSKRGFLTITGFYKGTAVSIIGTGMGTPMIDFTIREARAMIPSCTTVAMIRVGTCGTPSANVALGDVVVAANSTFLRRNPDAYHDPELINSSKKTSANSFYSITKPVSSDSELTYRLFQNLRQDLNDTKIVRYGLDVTADSFYSSQGRILNDFEDHNEDLIKTMIEPMNALSLQMETFHLFDLARSSNVHSKIIAAANCLVIAQRHTDEFIDEELKHKRELSLGKSALETLIQTKL